MSRDILVGEVVPVVRLSHLALLPRAHSVVTIVDVRDCSRGDHAVFLAEVRRVFPECSVLHCPGALLRAVQVSDSGPGNCTADDLEDTMLSSGTSLRGAVAGVRRGSGSGGGRGSSGQGTPVHGASPGPTSGPVSIALSVLNYDATGGLDVDKLNAAVGSATGSTTICKRTIESSLRMRPYKRFAGLTTTARHLAWLRRAAPELAGARGRCIALYGGTAASNLGLYRDMLVRCGFPCVCGLSLSFLVQRSQSTASYPAKPLQ
jgi:hypothetical protein